MANESPEIVEDELNELHTVILDTVNKGFTHVGDVLDYCGPRLEEQSRTLDSPAYLQEIDKLVEMGYLEREGQRFNKQLVLKLTRKGEEATPALSAEERSLIDQHGVSFSSLSVLKDVIDYENNEGSLPSISMIQERDDKTSSAYQYTAHFNKLTEAGLASENGIFRFRIEPSDDGRALVEEYASYL
jgi:DNA-binding MarR family transcriptional regulator